jgi:4-hydroxythreonine-4-phosphate dehydrogenase
MGDPQGIGPEVTVKALSQKKLLAKGSFIVAGDRKRLKGLPSSVAVVDVPYRSAGEGSLKFLDKGIDLIKGGVADVMVTAPLSKEKVSAFAKGFVGHTEYLAQAFGVKNFDMMFVAPGVRLTIVTRHVPLKEVPKLITQKAVFNSIALMAATLKERFKIKDPKIAVLGLNPHAGEGGLLGEEDMRSIVPAVTQAKRQGIKAIGPLPADTFFAFNLCHSRESGNPYDGIIAMYHDQGLTPLKGMYMKELVNFTAGLPFVRTCPAHGTAFDIVGRNKADPSSMLAALELACQLA